MAWLFGIVGFILGFAAGQWLLLRLLRDQSANDVVNIIKTDAKAKTAYGLLNWLCAIAGTIAAVMAWRLYQQHMQGL